MFQIDERSIHSILENNQVPSTAKVQEILLKAKTLQGITPSEALSLLTTTDDNLVSEIFATAKYIKQEIYGNRLVLFAPLYISNLCKNECIYCAFRVNNKKLKRKALSQDEIARETEILVKQGHKRVLLVAGETYPKEGLKYVYDSIETIYSITSKQNNIRRINVNIAPLTLEEFKQLANYKIGTYQLFQETYHAENYAKLHLKGPKADYLNRLQVMDRAIQGGIHDVGIGVLFGLSDWRYEVLAMLSHANYLDATYGIGPHTISVPRIEPALDSSLSYSPPHQVDDATFKKIIAVLRIAVPYTGIILSTRESPQIRRAAFELGVSQISAGSRTNPGGYEHEDFTNPNIPEGEESQFSLGDVRSLHEVIEDLVDNNYIPSFCTGCYRAGRVGKDFMDLAKPGLIKNNCLPNAFFTFSEYLQDFASSDLKLKGSKLIENMLSTNSLQPNVKVKTEQILARINAGERDLYI